MLNILFYSLGQVQLMSGT